MTLARHAHYQSRPTRGAWIETTRRPSHTRTCSRRAPHGARGLKLLKTAIQLAYSYAPLHKNVPKAALSDPRLYELLVLVDTLRDGNAREREIAVKALTKKLDDVSIMVHTRAGDK